MNIKKIIINIILIGSLSFFLNTFATDSCIKLTPKQINLTGNTTFRANIRTYPCVSKSKILFVSNKNQKFKIIEKVDGWYKIKLKNGNIGWIRDQAIKLENNYILTKKDDLFVKNISKALEKIIKKYGEKSRKTFIEKIKKILEKNNDIKFSKILEKIVFNLEKPIKKEEDKKNKKEITKTNNIKKLKSNDSINYDLKKIKKTWISWHNIERKKLGLAEYSEKEKLNISSTNWSVFNRNKKIMDHKRSPNDSYYDYGKITKWMKNNGVICKNIYRVTYSESIGRAWITCNKTDCTNEIIKGIKGTFDYFMNEKGISGIAGAHYRAIVHKTFKQIGFGLAIEKIGKNRYRVYHTTHYCTEVQ